MLEDAIKSITDELQNYFQNIDCSSGSKVNAFLNKEKNIYVTGAGRTGYIMRCFSMRLMQAGFHAYWIGDNNTPCAKKSDLLIIGSGSGETGTLRNYFEKARQLKMQMVVFTAEEDSTLARQADLAVVIKAPTKYEEDENKASVQPMASLFEQSLLIYLDAIILNMLQEGLISEEEMRQRHANLE